MIERDILDLNLTNLEHQKPWIIFKNKIYKMSNLIDRPFPNRDFS